MGRKPLGKHAMTAAERKRRQRAKDVTKPVTKSEPPPELIEEVERLRREVERLRSVNDALRQLYQEKQARRAKVAAADRVAAETYANDDRVTLLERLLKAEKQLAANRTRIKNLEEKVYWLRDHSPPRMSKQLYRQVLGLLHPDRAHGDEAMRQKLERCFKEFGAIKFTFPPKDE